MHKDLGALGHAQTADEQKAAGTHDLGQGLALAWPGVSVDTCCRERLEIGRFFQHAILPRRERMLCRLCGRLGDSGRHVVELEDDAEQAGTRDEEEAGEAEAEDQCQEVSNLTEATRIWMLAVREEE